MVEPPATGIARAALRRAVSCDDLGAMLRADALAKLDARIDQQIAWAKQYGSIGYATPAYDGEGQSNAGGADENGAALHSDTNVQVEGVDEGDIVKTDGSRLWVLHGQRFAVVDAWPPEALSLESSVAVDGQPFEMLVANGRAAVFSMVEGGPVHDAAGVTPKPLYQEYGAYGYGWAVADEGSSSGGSVTPAEPAPAPGTGEARSALTVAPALTKLTILALDAGAPKVVAEHWLEGNYVSARRIDDRVIAVMTGAAHGPELAAAPSFAAGATPTLDEIVAAWEALRVESAARIAAASVDDWLPWRFSRKAAAVVASTPPCEGFWVPTAMTTQYGLTQIAALDWTAPDVVGGPSVLGRTDTVYASKDMLVLAASAYDDAYLLDAATRADVATPVALERTHLHAFDLAGSPTDPGYLGSGTIPGHVDDQFSIDERAGDVRVAATEDRVVLGGTGALPPPSGPGAPAAPTRVNHVTVLRPASGELVAVGSTGDLAPGERIYSARFVGDRGYVVTYRQVDPLFVIDLADPAAPKVISELTIPGFSEYMHPIDAGHLLTIGRETEIGEGGGVHVVGLALQVFDVVDPASPELLHKLVYDDPAGGSTATYDHKAFTWFGAKQLLAFPYATWKEGASWPTSTLEVFSVDVATGFAKKGSIDHGPFFASAPEGYCGGAYGIEVRRGVFLDDVVMSVSYGGVVASRVDDLAGQPIAVLALPAPTGPVGSCKEGGVDVAP